jgi:integrase
MSSLGHFGHYGQTYLHSHSLTSNQIHLIMGGRVGGYMSSLTQLKVQNAKPGKHEDGRGLRLVVSKSGSKNWIVRVQSGGRRREIGLGSASAVGLAEARMKAEGVRMAIRAGVDPVAERRQQQTAPTFSEAARLVHAEHRPSWKNSKHAAQWLSSLERYVFPKLGDVQVDQITTSMIREVLLDIWLTIPETARRVRQRIGTVLDYAHSREWRDQEAPLRSVSKGLPKQPKGQTHYAAMPWRELPDFIANMPETIKANDTVRSALGLLILTATRSGEVRGAVWSEVDLSNEMWTIPAERMKAGVVHRIPLSDDALAILERMSQQRRTSDQSEHIFEGRREGRPLSDMTLTMPLRRADLGITVHGFRSAFRDWCGEATNTPREIAEACLAHTLTNKVEAAYARTDYFDKRRDVMNRWAAFCCSSAKNNLISIDREAAS